MPCSRGVPYPLTELRVREPLISIIDELIVENVELSVPSMGTWAASEMLACSTTRPKTPA
eukprot:scaffold213922_cov28-Tisochrysis_lutea.AAC.4